MKKISILFTVMLLAMASFVSCSKDKDEEEKNKEPEKMGLNETISAKWEIKDPNSPYASFEFSKDGNYIVLENTATRASNLSPVHVGTYKIEGDKIILSGFGTLEVISITAEEFSFYFTLEETGEKGQYKANKSAETIVSSSRTELLCRTWKFSKMTIDETLLTDEDKRDLISRYGTNWKANLEKEWKEQVMAGISVLFSRAGTYLVLYNGEVKGESGLSEWKWANSEETAFYYSWNNWQTTGGPVPIKELTAQRFVIQEKYLIEEFIAK